MKKKLITAIITSITTLTLTSCQSVPASEMEIFTDGTEITSIETTETGTLYTFTDGTGYYQEENEIPQLSNVNGLYPLTGIVTEIEYDVEPDTDLVTITTSNGNMFAWYADSSDCWMLNDLASCIMDSKGTEIVYDDEVLLAHYAGVLEHLEKYAVK